MKKIILMCLFGLMFSQAKLDTSAILTYDDALKIASNAKLLDIPIYTMSPDSPKEGFCGEASIQMILSFYGLEKNQFEINKAGNPDSPDLQSDNLVASIMNITENKFSGYEVMFVGNFPSIKQTDDFKVWIKEQIDTENPIIGGFKINPSYNHNWGIDHLSVINGYDENGIYILTTFEDNPKIYRTWEQLIDPNMDYYSNYNRRTGQIMHYGVIITKNEFENKFEELDLLLPKSRDNWKSPESSDVTTILIQNNSSDTIEIDWIDYNGKSIKMQTIEPAYNITQQASYGHVFSISNTKNKKLYYFIASKMPSRIIFK